MDWLMKVLALMTGIPLGFSGLWLVFLSICPKAWYSGGSVRRRWLIGCAGIVLLVVSVWLCFKVF